MPYIRDFKIFKEKIIMKYTFSLTYSVGAKRQTIHTSNADIRVETQETKNRLSIKLYAAKPVQLIGAKISYACRFGQDDTFFANGFQSWTDTREFSKTEKMPDQGFVARTPFGKKMGLEFVGDYTYCKYSKKTGIFHSDSYAYVNRGNKIELVGSLSDRSGWTVIYANMHQNHMFVYKDVEGVVCAGEYALFDLYFDEGAYDDVFDRYFAAMQIKPLTDQKIRGYTSWYNYYQNISEEVVLRDLEALARATDRIDTFQIDDGYQTAVGDWLSIDKKKFPNGMKPVADAIHAKGLQAGIWLAPLGAQHNSAIAKEHPNWLVKNKKGKPFYVGGNWGGFYALDIYNEEVRAYIRHFFDVVLNTWGFDLVKLDFLYAAAVLPRNGKSRGEIMYDAMDLIREAVGEKKILGCGVPMMPCFGKVEYMRIGADMSLHWADDFSRKRMHREDVSTVNAIYNSIYRRHLNERAFLCDPDVFLLRDYNIQFTFEQRKALAKFIKIFGSVIFTSDDVGRYNAEQLACLEDTLSPQGAQLEDVWFENAICKVRYKEGGESGELAFDIHNGHVLSI